MLVFRGVSSLVFFFLGGEFNGWGVKMCQDTWNSWYFVCEALRNGFSAISASVTSYKDMSFLFQKCSVDLQITDI